jgi:hypothetical protein
MHLAGFKLTSNRARASKPSDRRGESPPYEVPAPHTPPSPIPRPDDRCSRTSCSGRHAFSFSSITCQIGKCASGAVPRRMDRIGYRGAERILGRRRALALDETTANQEVCTSGRRSSPSARKRREAHRVRVPGQGQVFVEGGDRWLRRRQSGDARAAE